jgi:rod shape-determining protein MreD
MIYYVGIFVFAYIGLLIQSTLTGVFSLAGAAPDLLLIMVVFNSIFEGPRRGAYAGFGIGLLEDLYIGRFIGMNALVKGIAGFLSGRLTQGAFRENMWVPVLMVILNSVLNILLYFLLGRILGETWSLNLLYWKGLPEFMYTLCLVPFLYGPFFACANKRLNKQKG